MGQHAILCSSCDSLLMLRVDGTNVAKIERNPSAKYDAANRPEDCVNDRLRVDKTPMEEGFVNRFASVYLRWWWG